MRALHPGIGEGPLLKLSKPISFWGGVDPERGAITNVRHPEYGACIAGTILAIPRTIGSSSASAVLLELIRRQQAPAGLILGNVDAVLVIGCIVGRELGYRCPPMAHASPDLVHSLPQAGYRLEIQDYGQPLFQTLE